MKCENQTFPYAKPGQLPGFATETCFFPEKFHVVDYGNKKRQGQVCPQWAVQDKWGEVVPIWAQYSNLDLNDLLPINYIDADVYVGNVEAGGDASPVRLFLLIAKSLVRSEENWFTDRGGEHSPNFPPRSKWGNTIKPIWSIKEIAAIGSLYEENRTYFPGEETLNYSFHPIHHKTLIDFVIELSPMIYIYGEYTKESLFNNDPNYEFCKKIIKRIRTNKITFLTEELFLEVKKRFRFKIGNKNKFRAYHIGRDKLIEVKRSYKE
jgi:hypothetical protein